MNRRLFVLVFLLLLPITVLHRPLLLGEAFLPADLLRHVSPWKGMADFPAPEAAWNVLRYDGIAQFYPWRLQAARSVRQGFLPLWNPYQFGAEGGTPLLANSQSAPLYPPNLLFYLLPTWRAFGWAAALHLLIAAGGMYAFLRALPVRRLPALFGAATFTLSGPVTTWLALPTFLAVSCWLPWLLLLIKQAHTATSRHGRCLAVVGAGAVAGVLVLAGHLQIAFYCLLAGGLYALWQGARAARAGKIRPLPWLGAVGGAGLLAVCIAAPQVLPAVELSRLSHRAQTGPPTGAGYAAYTANALPPRNFVTLLAPDFFGHPNAGTYWNTGNYAEFAVYMGVLPLLLASACLALPWRGPDRKGRPPERGFFAGLGLLALLLALGTPIGALFFFGVPGFAQTGSPARVLLLVAFSFSVLAALGLQALMVGPKPSRRALLAAIAAPVALAVFGLLRVPAPLADVLAAAVPEMTRAAMLLLIGAAVLAVLPRLTGERRILAAGLCIALSLLDLLAWGLGYNPSAPPQAVYPVTPGIRWLQDNAKDALIAPLNRDWSLSAIPPRGAVLPPNALTVFALHDLAGYDSLFPARAKQRLVEAVGTDPSPLENGNLVFIKSVEAAKALGARFLVVAPEARGRILGDRSLREVYAGPDLVIYENPAGREWQPPVPRYAPASFRLGLFLGLCAAAALAAFGVVGWRRGAGCR